MSRNSYNTTMQADAERERSSAPSLPSLPYGRFSLHFPGNASPDVRILIWGGSVALVTLLLLTMHAQIQQSTALLLYLLVILVNAIISGLWVGIGTSILAFVAINYFFMEPYHAIGITSFEDTVRLVTFLSVAIVVSSLAGRARDHAALALRRATHLATLYRLSQAVSAEVELERILPTIATTTTQLLERATCSIELSNDTGTTATPIAGGERAGEATEQRVDIPISHANHAIGTLCVVQHETSLPLNTSDYELLQMIATQVALVVERARLVEAVRQASILSEADRLKSTLLSSVSHDLRTPLAVMKGAVSNLLDESVVWEQSARREFLTTIDDEINRLNRLVGDLLVMSRIEAGALEYTRRWHDLADLVEQSLARLTPILAHHHLVVDVSADLPPVRVNYTHIDHVLTNLLENAVHYTPQGTEITVRAWEHGAFIQIDVCDQGPGLPEALLPLVFDKFVRGQDAESHAEGSGLGLAICKGLVEAHGGTIWATNRPECGTCITFTLPQEAGATTHRAHGSELETAIERRRSPS